MIPLVRAFVSLPAGIAKMPFGRFTVLSLIGSIPWVLGLALARRRASAATGRACARASSTSTTRSSRWSWSAIVYAVVRRRRAGGDRADARHDAGAAERARSPLRHAVALGLLQGPTELLPVSSSAHTTLIPWLAGWPYAELDAELRKSFEVALHAGAGLALAIDLRAELLAATLARSTARRRP